MFKLPGIDAMFSKFNKSMRENSETLGYKEEMGDHNQVSDGPFKKPRMFLDTKPQNYVKTNFLSRIIKNNDDNQIAANLTKKVGMDSNYRAQDDLSKLEK
jgi:hypothetical protein